jgi:hypothetical protein
VILAQFGNKDLKNQIRTVITSPVFRSKAKPGKRIRLNTSTNDAFHFISDNFGLVVLVVTPTSYPQRVVFSGLCVDLRDQFTSRNFDWTNAGENSLTVKMTGIMKTLSREYEDVSGKSKLEALKHQVDGVKEIVGHNIEKALANLETTQSMEEKSEKLLETATVFEKSAKKLAWREWCALMKMRFIFFAIFMIIAVIIFAIVCGNTRCLAGGALSPSPK